MSIVIHGNTVIDLTSKTAYKHVSGPWFRVFNRTGRELGGTHWGILPEYIRTRFLEQAKGKAKKAA